MKRILTKFTALCLAFALASGVFAYVPVGSSTAAAANSIFGFDLGPSEEETPEAAEAAEAGETAEASAPDETSGMTETSEVSGKPDAMGVPVEAVDGEIPDEAAAAAEQAVFAEFTHNLLAELLSEDSISLHYLIKDPENLGIDPGEPSLGDASLEEYYKSGEDIKAYLAELEAIDYDLLTEDQQFVYMVILDNLECMAALSEFDLYDEELSPTIGIQSELPILLAEYSFFYESDIETYLALLPQLPGYYSQLIEFEKAKAEAGLFMSDAAVDDIVVSCEAYLQDTENHFLISTFDARIDAFEGLTDEQRADYKQRNREAFDLYVPAAYQILIDGLTALKGSGSNEIGLAGLPEGQAYYEALFAYYTGSQYSVEEMEGMIEDRLYSDLFQVSMIAARNPDVVDGLGTFAFTLTDPAEILTDLQGKVVDDFPALPETSYVIGYVPEPLQDVLSPAFYLTPPMDDYSLNSIYINEGQLDPSTLYSTLAHEGYPGHLLQTVYSLSHLRDPIMAAFSCTGYSEGWATYVEFQSYLYDTDQPEDLMRIMSLNASATLALYALGDIYIHYEGMSREEIGDFLSYFFGVEDEETRDLFYNYIVESPGNYSEYYVGYLEIQMMREEAEEALGDGFDALAFNTFILDMGEASFRVIRPYFEEWLAAQSE